jgi:hypothetical protein
MSNVAATAQVDHSHTSIARAGAWFDRRRLFWLVFVVAGLVYSQFEFWKQPCAGDRANWDYFAQVIARGGVAYRDVHNIKSPLSAYIGAAAILITRPLGVPDVLSMRATFILLAALTVAFTFLVTLDYFGSRRAALLAALIMLTFGAFARLNGGGVQPKTPMVLFGLIALWAILKDRPFVAGLFGMLSAMSWQPGLLFVGAAGLAFSRYLTNWRDLKVVRLIAGAAIPLAVMLGYFWAAGALRDFYLWNIHFNATVYGPGQARPLSSFFHRLSRMMAGTYHNGRFYFYLAAPGFIVAIAREIKRARERGTAYLKEAAPRHAIMIAPLVYFLFCMVDIQGGADLIPLLPFVAAFAALALVFALELAGGLIARKTSRPTRAAVEGFGYALLCAFIFVLNVSDAFFIDRTFPTLKDQQAEVAEITSYLQPGDKIFVHGQAEILVLSGLTNASKYFLLDRGKDGYLDQVEPGGFAGWFERLKAERPKVVALDRLKTLDHTEDFQAWVSSDYEAHEGRIFTYYVRKGAGDLVQ